MGDLMRQLTTDTEDGRTPSIAVVVGAYNAEQWIGETLGAILSQTHPPDEVIVVDDGSTDGTARELERFGCEIRVVTQANGGCPAAFNRGFSEASSDYIAMCGADDVWEPEKLERQVAALAAHPEIDLAYCGARNFGVVDDPWPPAPEEGLLSSREFLPALYSRNIICASSVLIRRSLYARLGPFVESAAGERFACDDYDYWIRALAAGAVFHYDPRFSVNYRRHASNATNDQLWIHRSRNLTHRWHAEEIDDAALVRAVLADDLLRTARAEIDFGERHRARAMFASSLRYKVTPRAAIFVLLLSLPEQRARRVLDRLVRVKRALLAHA